MNKALFIGRSVVDVLSHVQHFPSPDEKVKALHNEIFSGGSSLNAAVTFAHLEGEAFLYTSLSESGVEYELITNELRYGLCLSSITLALTRLDSDSICSSINFLN